MTHTFRFLVPVAALACVSCVQTDGEPVEPPVAGLSSERACFFARDVNGYSEAPDGPRGDRLYVKTGVDERFLLETWGSCPELDWSYRIAIDTRFSSSLCTGETVTVLVPRSLDGAPDRCTARILGAVTD